MERSSPADPVRQGPHVASLFRSSTFGRSRWMTTDPQQRVTIQTGGSSNVLFDVLNACVGQGYPPEADALANTPVVFRHDNPRRCQDPCLFTCTQLRSLFARSLSVIVCDIAGERTTRINVGYVGTSRRRFARRLCCPLTNSRPENP